MNWQELQQASIEEVLRWAQPQPWCRAMAECSQEAQWHGEGDVWTHTQMVCRQLPCLDDWQDLSPREQTMLLFTALLHDSAKPLTSEFDSVTGRIRSPRHAVHGEHLARGVLRALGCDLATRESICKLVRYHGRPAFLSERNEPAHQVVRMSWLLSNRLLYLFALADTRGRDTDSMNRPEENLLYWKLLSQEHGCYECPYPFASDHARFVFARDKAPNLHYVPHEDFSCQVTMLAGLPGSGKDTWLNKHRPDLPVVSLDEIRDELEVTPTDNQGSVVQAAQERCREHLRSKRSFAFNATNLIQQTRNRWIGLFDDYHAHMEIVYLEPPFERLLRQNRDRDRPVPENAIRKMAAKCEPPDNLDAHRVTLLEAVI